MNNKNSHAVVQVNTAYANARPGVDYPVIEEGYDFLKLRVQGKPLCVPDFVIGYAPKEYYEPKEYSYEYDIAD